MRIARLMGLLLLLAAAGPGGSDGEPGGYALRLAIRPAPGGGAQRLLLPAAALAALREPDGRDLRVFDRRGRAVPIARLPLAAPLRRDELAASPILGPPDAPAGARVSVRLDDQGRARVAEVEGAGAAADGRAAVLGALLDARGVRGGAVRLELDADLPAGQPVRFAVEASRDLDGWRPLGARVLYRAPGAAAGAEAVPLDGAPLDGERLRVTWRAGSRLLGPVAVRRAVLVSRGPGASEVPVDATPPAPVDDARAIEFAVPFALPVASLRVVPADDAPVPFRVLGRNEPERPWTVLGEGVAAPGRAGVPLEGAAVRVMRIEADPRSAGFAAPPALRFGFAPRAVAFAASGPPPFTLAAGRAGAADAFLPLDGVAGGRADPPDAAVEGGSAAPVALAPPDGAGAFRRRALLWAILLGAVALLGGMAWALWRRAPAPTP